MPLTRSYTHAHTYEYTLKAAQRERQVEGRAKLQSPFSLFKLYSETTTAGAE